MDNKVKIIIVSLIIIVLIVFFINKNKESITDTEENKNLEVTSNINYYDVKNESQSNEILEQLKSMDNYVEPEAIPFPKIEEERIEINDLIMNQAKDKEVFEDNNLEIENIIKNN